MKTGSIRKVDLKARAWCTGLVVGDWRGVKGALWTQCENVNMHNIAFPPSVIHKFP